MCDRDDLPHTIKSWAFNVPVVYMARDEIIFIRANPFRGWAWKSRLFWALKWQRANWVPLGPKKSRFSGPTPYCGPSNGFSPIKIIKTKRPIKNRSISNFICDKYRILFRTWKTIVWKLICLLLRTWRESLAPTLMPCSRRPVTTLTSPGSSASQRPKKWIGAYIYLTFNTF